MQTLCRERRSWTPCLLAFTPHGSDVCCDLLLMSLLILAFLLQPLFLTGGLLLPQLFQATYCLNQQSFLSSPSLYSCWYATAISRFLFSGVRITDRQCVSSVVSLHRVSIPSCKKMVDPSEPCLRSPTLCLRRRTAQTAG